MDYSGWGLKVAAHQAGARGHDTPAVYNVPTPLGAKMQNYVDNKQLIGAKSLTLVHSEAKWNGAGTPLSAGTAFTVTTFDTVTRADSAKILLNNGSGDTMIMLAAAIKGSKIYRLSGDNGYIHDKYVNYESIAQDGDKLFQLSNNMICDLTQINMLADIWWKRNKTKRHIYTITQVGFNTFFEPGEWYTLQVGSAGKPEYINSLCECYSVKTSLDAGGLGSTDIAFREVVQNWVFDSNETARFIAGGGFQRKAQGRIVTVASSTFIGNADYYCDGTDDDVEINNAINLLQAQGGGTVLLTQGTFNTSAAIIMSFSNISLSGSGTNTIIASSSAAYALQCYGTAGTHISGCMISNIQFTNPKRIDVTYSDGFSISNVLFSGAEAEWAIYILNSDSVRVISNIFDGQLSASNAQGCIRTEYCLNATISNNVIKAIRSTGMLSGINNGDSSRTQISNNFVYDISTSSTTWTAIGISSNMDYCKINDNKVEMVKNSGVSTLCFGMDLVGISNSVTNNYLINNGTDTGIANTNGCNFYDGGTNTQYAG
jgi:hypothetical protein